MIVTMTQGSPKSRFNKNNYVHNKIADVVLIVEAEQ